MIEAALPDKARGDIECAGARASSHCMRCQTQVSLRDHSGPRQSAPVPKGAPQDEGTVQHRARGWRGAQPQKKSGCGRKRHSALASTARERCAAHAHMRACVAVPRRLFKNVRVDSSNKKKPTASVGFFCLRIAALTAPCAGMRRAYSQFSAPPVWYSVTRVSKKLRSFFRSIISLIHGNGFSSCANSASRPICWARRLAMKRR